MFRCTLSPLSRLLLLALLSVLSIPSGVHADTGKTLFNVTVSDQSPTITYSPSRSGPIDQTWNSTYSGSSWGSYTNQTIGQGISSHYTTHIGANASLSFWGTSVYLWADVKNAQDLQVTIDKNQTTKKIDGGYMLDNLSDSWHILNVNVVGNGGVRLYGVTFTTGIGENGATPVNSTVQAIFGEKQINGMFSQSSGQWETATLVGGGGNQAMQTYNRLDSYTPGSKLIFQPPSNTSFILLYGSVNFDHGQFSVSLSSTNLPNVATSGGDGSTTTTTTTVGGIPSNQNFWGGSPWISTDQVLYYANLDQKSQYTITVENQGQGKPYWDISKVVFVQAQGGSNSNKNSSNTAAIAGGVAGGVVALALIAIVLWFFLIYKKRDSRKKNQETDIFDNKPFEVDPYRSGSDRDATDAYANASSGSHTPYDRTPPPGNHRDSYITPLLLESQHSPDLSRQGHDLYNSRSSYASVNSPNPNRLSIPISSSDGYHSTRNSYQDGGGPILSGMILHNPDQSIHSEQSDIDQNSENGGSRSRSRSSLFGVMPPSENPKSRYVNQRSGNNRRSNNFVQERDAGSLPIPPSNRNQEPTVIPPSYDPSWAAGRDTDQTRDVR
ncbi:uncharacterized protein L201_007993 [Kwoniella dendrophila CBS 6074]|uniref:Uncharacterized protein n=1 Tax=Kwoniella dendrophila CBS 6074 TaxID=1295534 RepID=A0AAX4K6L5_9TREE